VYTAIILLVYILDEVKSYSIDEKCANKNGVYRPSTPRADGGVAASGSDCPGFKSRKGAPQGRGEVIPPVPRGKVTLGLRACP
jgi:hypothetical protein